MKIIVVILMLSPLHWIHGQHVAFQLSPGFGRVFSADIEDKHEFRISFSIAADYFISDRLSVGPEIIFSGRLKGPVSPKSYIDPNTGIELLEPASTRSNVKLAKAKYFLERKDSGFFASIGIGYNTFKYKEGTDDGPAVLASKNTFAFPPEAGYQFNGKVALSFRFIYAGKTPEYSGLNSAQQEVFLRSAQLNPFLFSFIYQFTLAKVLLNNRTINKIYLVSLG